MTKRQSGAATFAASTKPSGNPTVMIAEEWLCESPYAALQEVTCTLERGVLSLRGRVPSQYLKQIAQTIVAHVPGVEHIDNRIEVVRASRENEVEVLS